MLIRETKHQPAVLTSWKEVAAYLGKGVRTAQRWEKEDGLPVRRIAGTFKIVVHRDELDKWLHAQPSLNHRPVAAIPAPLEVQVLHENMKLSDQLRQSTAALLDSLASEMQSLVEGCRRMASQCGNPVHSSDLGGKLRATVANSKLPPKTARLLDHRVS